jgi:hypothetical protein
VGVSVGVRVGGSGKGEFEDGGDDAGDSRCGRGRSIKYSDHYI